MERRTNKTLRMENLESRKMKTGDIAFEVPDGELEGIVIVCYPPGDDGAENEDERENGYCDIYVVPDADDANGDPAVGEVKAVTPIRNVLADYAFATDDDELRSLRGVRS